VFDHPEQPQGTSQVNDRWIGARISMALETTGMTRARAALELGLPADRLAAYCDGRERAGALFIAKVAALTGRTATWFFPV
jgi:hypothetical protein